MNAKSVRSGLLQKEQLESMMNLYLGIKGECICNRPRGKILCKSCGHILEGRVRRPCPLHPKVIFLMDKEQCPRCKAYSQFMQELRCSR